MPRLVKILIKNGKKAKCGLELAQIKVQGSLRSTTLNAITLSASSYARIGRSRQLSQRVVVHRLSDKPGETRQRGLACAYFRNGLLERGEVGWYGVR